MKESVIEGSRRAEKSASRAELQRDPWQIPPTKCPIGTLNPAPFVWMCLISQGPVIKCRAKHTLIKQKSASGSFFFLRREGKGWSRRSDLNR